MTQLTCIVVTPETTALEEKTEFVVLPLFDGEIGIAPGHSPMIGRLGYGEMRLKTATGVSRYYLDGGFVQVADNVVSVLTSRAIAEDQVDFEAAQQLLETALKRPANSAELLDIRDRVVSQARAQLRIAKRAK